MKTQEVPIVPKDFAGMWIAWNANATEIIASGPDLETVRQDAEEAGEANPSFEKVPPAEARIVGAIR